MASVSTLEMLPDELLLEVCKYLLCIDVLQSFFDLNGRMTRLIKNYRDNVSLHKGSFGQCDYVYANVFPKIGSHIRTLVIDRLYSVLQVNMFYRYLNNQKLSNIFPRLEKITLVSFRHDMLLSFVNMLEDFEHLIQLNICNLFDISLEHQPSVLKALLTANNQKIRSVNTSDGWSCLRLDNLSNISYSNITNLQITMASFKDFLFLFSFIPNVTQLDVILTENDMFEIFNDDIPSLVHLTNFRLTSVYRPWIFDELVNLLHRIENVKYLTLQLFTFDTRLIDGQQVLILHESLSHMQQFNYGVYYITDIDIFDRDSILASWPPSSIECLVDKTSDADNIFAFIYTLSSCHEPFTSLGLPGAIISKIMPPKKDDNQVKKLTINKVSRFLDCLPLMARWCRVKELMIWFSIPNPTTAAVTGQQQQQCAALIPKMARLKHLTLYGSVPSDFHHLSLILVTASNLIRLDLSFDSVLLLLDNEETSRLVQQRIRALSINKVSSSSSSSPVTVINEHHIPRIASTFSRLRHIYVNLTHLLPSIDSMILCILTEFKKQLVSLGADGSPSEEMKTDPRKWLEDNNNKSNMNIVHPTEFDAYFHVESNRLLIWT